MNIVKRILWAVADRATIYLPILLMGLMALGTWWLARNTPVVGVSEPERPALHEPDYFMRDFSVRSYDAQGTLKSDMRGESATHFADTEVLEIENARIRTHSKEGRLTIATANRAFSNGDGSEVQLVGNAIIVREAGTDAKGQPIPRMEFHGEFLHAFANTEQIKSHKPVLVKRGADMFTADAMTYDNLERVAELQGKVNVVLVPQPEPKPKAKSKVKPKP
jgi:lipopolysaccharide export system protein LptC